MVGEQQVLAVIPARGGSRGLPGKNIRPFAGLPLITHSILLARMCEEIDRLVVSTDDPAIAEVARKYGADVPFLRPAELARDDTPMWPVLRHALNAVELADGKHYDYLMLLDPTSPTRLPDDVSIALRRLSDTPEADGIIAVSQPDFNPRWLCVVERDGWMADLDEGAANYNRRQAVPDVYRINGTLYIWKAEFVRKQESDWRKTGRHLLHPVPDLRGIAIDNIDQFRRAELMVTQGVIQFPWVERSSNISPCFIIAEAGVNHGGDLNVAKRLVDAALKAGCDAVKFQTFKADRLVTADAPKAAYQVRTTGSQQSQLEMLRQLELSEAAQKDLFQFCRSRGILFLSTPFDEESADFLDGLGVKAFKIASGEITNIPLLTHIARKNKPMIVSTGMSTLEEVRAAVDAITAAGNRAITLLHCVSNYPASPADVNLKAMQTMAAAFGLPVGYSDHTTGSDAALAAVALGAVVIEKHFTLDRTLPGPDQLASIEPAELIAFVHSIRNVEAALGHGRKEPMPSEANTASVARRSLVAARTIPAGSILTLDMIVSRRPGTGLPPSMLHRLVGRSASQEIPAGTLLRLDMLS